MMKRMRVCLAGLLGLCLAACATSAAPTPVRPDTPAPSRFEPAPLPQTVEAALALVEGMDVCRRDEAFVLTPATPAPEKDGRASRLTPCNPPYPPVLRDNGFEAACLARFDLNPDGTVFGVRNACTTRQATGTASPAELEIADSMFLRLAFRALEARRWSAEVAGGDPDARINYEEVIRFQMPGTDALSPPRPELTTGGKDEE